MLTFHGGFSVSEVLKLKQDDQIIFPKIDIDSVFVPRVNTFDYYPRDMIFNDVDEKWKYISDDMFINQYIFLFKYLYNAYDFCLPYRNYILVADLEEELLNEYIGVGDYFNSKRIEYRVPRKFIKKENIIDFLYFDKWDIDQLKIYQERFKESYYSLNETEMANELMLKRSLSFNERKDKIN